MSEFIQLYGMEIISTIVLAVVSFIGLNLKRLYTKHVENTEKEKIVKTVIQAVEQLYSDLDGEEKYNKAVENIAEMLQERGICGCTDLEIKMLVESAVKEMKVNFEGGESNGSK